MYSLEIAVWELLFPYLKAQERKNMKGEKSKLNDKQPPFNVLHKLYMEFTDMQHCEEQGIVSILKGWA